MAVTRTRDQEFRRALVIRVGELIHGPRWIAPLAADLSRVTGRVVGGPQISHYLSFARPFPDWIESGMLRLLQDRTAAILEEGMHLRMDISILERRLASRLVASDEPEPEPAPEPEPEPEPEQDEAPSPGMM